MKKEVMCPPFQSYFFIGVHLLTDVIVLGYFGSNDNGDDIIAWVIFVRLCLVPLREKHLYLSMYFYPQVEREM